VAEGKENNNKEKGDDITINNILSEKQCHKGSLDQ